MSKYLITGAGGFVGGYLCRYLLENIADCQVLGLGNTQMAGTDRQEGRMAYEVLDLNNLPALEGRVKSYQPDYVIHLAAISSVGQSWQMPAETFKNNTGIYLNLLESVRHHAPAARILSVGSSEVYGTWDASEMPLSETHETVPDNPYGIARLAQEKLTALYVKNYGLDIVQTRSFIRQLVEMSEGKGAPVMQVGNIDVIRDFLDVRDVVRAYCLLLEKGKTGDVYNVCSGKGLKLRNIIEQAADILGIKPEIEVDKSRIRKNDAPVFIGNNQKIIDEISWKQEISINKTIKEMISDMR